MKIAIMGSGAIGGYYGARLQQGGADVTFIARGEQLKAFRQNGIALEGDRPIHLPTVKATDDPATIGKVDMVIFSVKLRDTESAAKQSDGRWDTAYAGSADMTIPQDFLDALEDMPAAKAFFATLDRRNLYSIYYRLHTTKKPETRARRIAQIVAKLDRGEQFH